MDLRGEISEGEREEKEPGGVSAVLHEGPWAKKRDKLYGHDSARNSKWMYDGLDGEEEMRREGISQQLQ